MRTRPARSASVLICVVFCTALALAQTRPGLKLPPADPNAPLPGATTRPAAPAAGPADMLALLRELKPLQKIHYSFPVPDAWLTPAGQPLAMEYARITHALSLGAVSTTGSQANVAVGICAALNRAGARPRVAIALNYSPWHNQFGKDLPPTDNGPTADAEVQMFRRRMELLRDWFTQAARASGESVDVGAVLLDSERFHCRDPGAPGAAEWNAAIRAKHDAFYDLCKSVFPEARVIWYGFGATGPASSESGWSRATYYDLAGKNDGWSTSLYYGPEIDTQRQQVRRTVADAEQHGVREVIPFVTLGCGYKRQVDGPEWAWTFVWNYDLVYSWQLGRELNVGWYGERPQRYAPYQAVPVVCFYPGPFDPRAPYWPIHFIAYVRGANDIKRIDDLERIDVRPREARP